MYPKVPNFKLFRCRFAKHKLGKHGEILLAIVFGHKIHIFILNLAKFNFFPPKSTHGGSTGLGSFFECFPSARDCNLAVAWIACLQIVVLAYISRDAVILLKALNSMVHCAFGKVELVQADIYFQ